MYLEVNLKQSEAARDSLQVWNTCPISLIFVYTLFSLGNAYLQLQFKISPRAHMQNRFWYLSSTWVFNLELPMSKGFNNCLKSQIYFTCFIFSLCKKYLFLSFACFFFPLEVGEKYF